MSRRARAIVGLSVAVISCAAFAVPASARAESIDSFSTAFDVKADSSFDVHERIVYDFEGAEKHGIYRDVPVRYITKSGLKARVGIYDLSVTDENGARYQYKTSSYGDYERIRIGDPDVLVTGVHTYDISYTVKDGLGYFDSYDEIYWNAVGTDWQIPIDNITAVVNLPADVAPADLRLSCYYGPQGAGSSCDASAVVTPRSITFSHDHLGSYEGLTVAVGFPKGLVAEVARSERFYDRFLSLDWSPILFPVSILVPIIVFVFAYRRWSSKGRDPHGTGVIVPQYDVIDGLSPMEAAFLSNGKFGQSLSAEIVYLAQRGYLSIERVESKILFFSTHEYVLHGLKAPDAALKPFQTKLLDDLFSTYPSDVKISSLRNSFYVTVKSVESVARDGLGDQGYYPLVTTARGNRVSGLEQGGGMAFLAFFFFMGGVWSVPFLGLGFFMSGLASAIILLVFAKIMPVMTEKGVAAKENLAGLKLYVSVAEKYRIEFHNAPEKNPQTFEKFLPYAMAFGVEKAWAKEFEGIYMEQPNWYADPTMVGFRAGVFASSMSDFTSAAHSNMATAPGSSSGSGGGGFSGGGGGGGGGGSW